MILYFSPVIPGSVLGTNKKSVYSPFDGDLVGTVATSDQSDVETALSNADRLFRDRTAWLSVRERIAILQSLKFNS